MIINDLDGCYIVFDTKNRNMELDTLLSKLSSVLVCMTFHNNVHTTDAFLVCQWDYTH